MLTIPSRLSFTAFYRFSPFLTKEDPDESMIAGAMALQAVGKVKDLLTGSEE